ncbi:MAG: DNA alkylation repair protein [Cellvibrionaceae bacterium]|nr:DNA alkylation repair protein [Cellvibrionaceae bacterium]
MPEPFKNLFNRPLIESLGKHLQTRYPSFDKAGFVRSAFRQFESLELKQRAAQITDALERYLPEDFLVARDILLAVLHPQDDVDLRELKMDERGVRGWAVMPMADYIARRGLNHFDASMDALRQMTSRFSAEFAVRDFIRADLPAALRHIKRWADSPNYHERRLASEGARPRLPWGKHLPALIADPRPMLPVLERLRDDPSDYVRRSVANHLNDIAKDHPQLLAELVKSWYRDAGPARQRMLRHACRTLIKKGDPQILSALGYTPAKTLRQALLLEAFALAHQRPKVGESLAMNIVLRSTHNKPQTLVVDYAIHFRRANGEFSVKVFKWKNCHLPAGESLVLAKRHSLKKITTRVYYPGAHKVTLQINGTLMQTLDFELCE